MNLFFVFGYFEEFENRKREPKGMSLFLDFRYFHEFDTKNELTHSYIYGYFGEFETTND